MPKRLTFADQAQRLEEIQGAMRETKDKRFRIKRLSKKRLWMPDFQRT
ncbi:hypothetical protein HQN89_19760 [Paenibacillus frigoriresistens]|nr:hypothetical protein [Paenibacillus frigoriresistens]NRF93211.1 hypothetical protein [Paenibacillus frigoriresistens]